ncbi:hypothetical protein J6590_000041 [Homalodisca vitripennis]|nr:hypothetical protein J6590_000041 [Homalodisca vitripennis]
MELSTRYSCTISGRNNRRIVSALLVFGVTVYTSYHPVTHVLTLTSQRCVYNSSEMVIRRKLQNMIFSYIFRRAKAHEQHLLRELRNERAFSVPIFAQVKKDDTQRLQQLPTLYFTLWVYDRQIEAKLIKGTRPRGGVTPHYHCLRGSFVPQTELTKPTTSSLWRPLTDKLDIDHRKVLLLYNHPIQTKQAFGVHLNRITRGNELYNKDLQSFLF